MEKKRTASSEVADLIPNKKQKLAESGVDRTITELSSAELRILLTFSQDGGENVRANIRRIRQFLEYIEQTRDTPAGQAAQNQLHDYLTGVVSLTEDNSTSALSDVLQTWSFAANANNNALLTSVTAVLALLLKVISTELSFRKLGTAVCQTLLKDDNVKTLNICLSAHRSQDQLLSASSRLITEIVSFDGGACAKGVYRQRGTFFKRLDELLGARASGDDGKKSRHTSSNRMNAVRFLLANLRVQESAIKNELLSDARRPRALFQNIAADAAPTIVAILQTIEIYILRDVNVTRHVKGRILTESTLVKVSSLYSYSDDSEQDAEVHSAAHAFLVRACCTSGAGLLLKTDGWYSPRTGQDSKDAVATSGPKYPARQLIAATSDKPVPIANNKISSFLQDLRPYAQLQHRELVLEIFKAAPELVADYFRQRKNFSFEPKLTSTWIGFSSLVLAMTKLPVPQFQATKGLPEAHVVLENLLPSSLSKKALTRCFNQSSTLIRLLTAKLLTSASRRLAKVLTMASQTCGGSSHLSTWKREVLSSFLERFPDMPSIIAALKSCNNDQHLLTEALLETISAVCDLAPQTIAQANFDASIMLTEALSSKTPVGPTVSALNIEHLLQIAQSTDLDWFRKPERLNFSPFTTVFRLWVENGGSQFQALLSPVLYDAFALQKSTEYSAIIALKISIENSELSDELWQFFDNCLLRFVQRPIKYEEERNKLVPKDSQSTISLLTVVVAEQWPHLVQAGNEDVITSTACWIARWLDVSTKMDEDATAVEAIKQKISETTPKYAKKKASKVSSVDMEPAKLIATAPPVSNNATSQEDHQHTAILNIRETHNHRLALPTHPDSYPELHRWTKKTLPDALEEGDIASLIWCLAAPSQSIRLQAVSQLQTLATSLPDSFYPEKAQLHLLLMELLETARTQHHLSATPLPSLAVALAARSALVLHDPTHALYPKVNRWLLRAPEWALGKLPSYWVSKILYAAPAVEADDRGLRSEVEWLYEVLLDGLRTRADVDLYRRCGVFEHVMVREGNQEEKIRGRVVDLLWRCSLVEEGAQTLVTRFGVLSWVRGKKGERYRALEKRILDGCDQEKLQEWRGGH